MTIDTTGRRSLRKLPGALLTDHGRLVIVGSETGAKWMGGIDRSVRALLRSPFIGRKMKTFIAAAQRGNLLAPSQTTDSGSVKPLSGATHELVDTTNAIRRMTTNHSLGKALVRVAGDQGGTGT